MKKFTYLGLLLITIAGASCKKVRVCECTITSTQKGQTYQDPNTGETTILSQEESHSETQMFPIETPMTKKNGQRYCDALYDLQEDEFSRYEQLCKLKN